MKYTTTIFAGAGDTVGARLNATCSSRNVRVDIAEEVTAFISFDQAEALRDSLSVALRRRGLSAFASTGGDAA